MKTAAASLILLACALAGLGAIAGCNTLQNAAANDPQKCERDPKCTGKGHIADCEEQCTESPDCTDRCREMNASSGQTEPR